ncbi:MAG: hypothetical protein J7J44_00330 [Deltaproteobacteria bacterium]|nr:hypothetical protein [Deltaproteobacteria bacterium]
MIPDEREVRKNIMDELDFHQIDFHIHTTESPSHGAIPLDEVIRAASRKGLRCITLTEHWKPETDPSIFSEERELIERADTELKIFLSAEVSPLNIQGDTPVDPKVHRDILEEMDYLSAGPHQHEETLSKGKAEIIARSHVMLMNILEDDLFGYVLHPWVTVIADLFSRGHSRVLTFEDIPEKYLDEFAEAAAFYKKGIEIYSPAAVSVEGYDWFVKKLLKAGVKIGVGSDTHQKEDNEKGISKTTQAAVRLIRSCGGNRSSLWLPENF